MPLAAASERPDASSGGVVAGEHRGHGQVGQEERQREVVADVLGPDDETAAARRGRWPGPRYSGTRPRCVSALSYSGRAGRLASRAGSTVEQRRCRAFGRGQLSDKQVDERAVQRGIGGRLSGSAQLIASRAAARLPPRCRSRRPKPARGPERAGEDRSAGRGWTARATIAVAAAGPCTKSVMSSSSGSAAPGQRWPAGRCRASRDARATVRRDRPGTAIPPARIRRRPARRRPAPG